MDKVKTTYYVRYESSAKHAAMEVFQEVFDVDFTVSTLCVSGDILFWVGGIELIVNEIGSGIFRVDVLEDK